MEIFACARLVQCSGSSSSISTSGGKRRWRRCLDKCGSVDTLDCNPAPALPPRRPPWPSSSSTCTGNNKNNNNNNTTTNNQQHSNNINSNSASGGGSGGTSNINKINSNNSNLTSTTIFESGINTRLSNSARQRVIAAAAAVAAPVLTPPNYPAPPRPPSRNGGDEALVARAGGSGRGASCCTLANGTALPRALPPRAGAAAGWSVPQATATTAAATTTIINTANQTKNHQQSSSTSFGLISPSTQWASHNHQSQNTFHSQQSQQSQQSNQRINPSPASKTATDAQLHNLQRQQQWQQQQQSPSLLASIGDSSSNSTTPMSYNAATASPPSRPPSSASTTSSSLSSQASLARVHDHSRPLPPPRIIPEQPPPASPRLLNVSNFSTGTTTTSTPTSFRSVSRTPLDTSSILSSSRQNTTTTTATTTPTTAEVSLQAPRPDVERIANEYVETPFRPTNLCNNNRVGEETVDGQLKANNHQRTCPKTERRLPFGKVTTQQPRIHHRHQQQQRINQRQNNNFGGTDSHLESLTGRNNRTITKQPVSFTKEPASNTMLPGSAIRSGLGGESSGLSIMCEHCGKCRCESCREPPPLPSRWLCDNSCLCSVESALDYASCLCCVKGLFYHCADGGVSVGASSSLESDLGNNCADEPCSCTGSRKTARWTCLGALALLLPCLLCYWPLKGCVAICEACYAKHAIQGCRCDPRNLARHLAMQQGLVGTISGDSISVNTTTTTSPTSQVSEALMRDSRDPEKRLLDHPIGPDL